LVGGGTLVLLGDEDQLFEMACSKDSNIQTRLNEFINNNTNNIAQCPPPIKYLQISIRDTGPGIPTSSLCNLFQPFSQGAQSTYRKYGGSGLGLIVARKCLGKLKGVMVVKSLVGVGTRLTVTIPLVE
ncbi:Histidine kinase osmosensor, partial [Blyttiomyces sp. JEL0837]